MKDGTSDTAFHRECDEHAKLYSGERFATNPPKWHWICETCGETGTWKLPERPHVEPARYADALEKFDPEADANHLAFLRREADILEAQQMAYELGTVTDTLNESLIRSQAALGKLKLGVPGKVALTDECLLTFRKKGSKWVFFVETAESDTELLSETRELRLLAADKMEELLQDLLRTAGVELKKARRSITLLEEFSDRLEVARK